MSEYNKENFQDGKLDYFYVGLMSQKINIGIIGGGRAAYIKAVHFLKDNCNVEIISYEFSKNIINLGKEYKNNLKLRKEKFFDEFLNDKHIIVIAVNDEYIIEKVEEFCNKNYRIFINCVNFKDGMGIIPVEVKSENLTACVNSMTANPKGTVMVGRKIKEVINEYDDFIKFSSMIRNKGKSMPEHKKLVLDIAGSAEFKEYYDKGLAYEYLRKFFDDEIVLYLIS